MIRLKKYVKLIILILGVSLSTQGQNLYDLDHSRAYADFLYQSQQFKLASMEYERLVFMDSANTQFKYRLISSFRNSNQISQGLSRIQGWYPTNIPDTTIYREYVKLKLLDSRFTHLRLSLNNNAPLSLGERNYYELSSLMLHGKWQTANEFILEANDKSWPGFSELSNIHSIQKGIKYKKPGIALALSAVIPGMGKVYSKDWKDGLISFLFVATNAYQSYRGFSKNGIKSAYGWIFGSLALGFYGGNLFGSWKSVKEYNQRSEDIIYHDVQNSVFDRF